MARQLDPSYSLLFTSSADGVAQLDRKGEMTPDGIVYNIKHA